MNRREKIAWTIIVGWFLFVLSLFYFARKDHSTATFSNAGTWKSTKPVDGQFEEHWFDESGMLQGKVHEHDSGEFAGWCLHNAMYYEDFFTRKDAETFVVNHCGEKK